MGASHSNQFLELCAPQLVRPGANEANVDQSERDDADEETKALKKREVSTYQKGRILFLLTF